MAAWDNVQSPGSPTPASYAAPLLDLSKIGNLGNEYFKGQQQNRELKLQQPILGPDGKPTTDFNLLSQELLKRGGAPYAQQLMPLLLDQQQASQPWPGKQSQAQPQSQPSNVTFAAPGIPDQAPTRSGGDNGTNTVMSAVGEAGVPDDQAGYVSNTIAKRLGIDPNAPVTNPAMKANIDNQLKAYLKTAQPGQQPAPQAGPGQQSTLPPGHSPEEMQALYDRAQQKYDMARRAVRHPESAKALTAAADKDMQLYQERAKAVVEHGPGAIERKKIEDQNKDDVTRYGKTLAAIQGSAGAASRMLQHIQFAEGVYKDPNFYSGAGENLNLMYKKVVNALNPNNTEALPQEAFRKTMAAAVLNQVEQLKDDTAAVGGGGRIFQAQIELMEKAANNPDNTVPANRLLTEIAKRSALESKKIAEMANKYKGGHLDANFAQMVDDHFTKHPMFSDAEINNINLIAPPVLKTPQDIAKIGLKSGDPFKTPDGRIKYVP